MARISPLMAALLAGAISISALAADDDVSKAKPNPSARAGGGS